MLKLLTLSTDPIMRLLVEREASEKVNLDELENIPVVWRYKSPITLGHLRETLEGHAPQSDFKRGNMLFLFSSVCLKFKYMKEDLY